MSFSMSLFLSAKELWTMYMITLAHRRSCEDSESGLYDGVLCLDVVGMMSGIGRFDSFRLDFSFEQRLLLHLMGHAQRP